MSQIEATITKNDDEESVKLITSYRELCEQVYDSNYDSDSRNYVAAISSDAANHLEPPNAKVQFGKITAISKIDSGSACSIITKTLAIDIVKTTPTARWIASECEEELRTFSNEPIKVLGKTTTTVAYNDWMCEDVCLIVVDDGHKIIIGRDFFSDLGLAVVQQQAKD